MSDAPSRPRLLGLHHIAIVVPDVISSVAVFVEHKGFKTILMPNLGFPGAWIQRGRLVLHLLEGVWRETGFNWSVLWNGAIHVTLKVYALGTSGRFYRDVIGVPLLTDEDWVSPEDMVISLIPGGTWTKPTAPDTRSDHIAFGVADLDAAETWIKHCGVTYIRKTQRDSGIEQIFLIDPDGHTLELNPSPMP